MREKEKHGQVGVKIELNAEGERERKQFGGGANSMHISKRKWTISKSFPETFSNTNA